MSPTIKTGTSAEVLDYYSRNWESIAHCYELQPNGLPVDPAWYRRQLYNRFLDELGPRSVLDIGCGGGWTLLDALDRGIDARGIEPVGELCAFAADLLRRNGYDPARVSQNDLAVLSSAEAASEECIALLSVLPHVPAGRWESVHADIARVLKPGGRLIAAYRNELFDLFTFNSFTVETFDRSIWGGGPGSAVRSDDVLAALKGLMTYPDVPGPYFTAASDKSFGTLKRVKSNPLTIRGELQRHDLRVERIRFYHFHCVPPLIADRVPDFAELNHRMEAELADDWRGTLMAAMFLVEAVRT